MEKWTKADEDLLQELQERKARVDEARRAPLIRMIQDDLPCSMRGSQVEELVDWMIHNADELRDALQPFDSGDRPPEAR